MPDFYTPIETFLHFNRATIESDYLPFAGSLAEIEEFRSIRTKFLILGTDHSSRSVLSAAMAEDFGVSASDALELTRDIAARLRQADCPTIRDYLTKLGRASGGQTFAAQGNAQICLPLVLFGELPRYQADWKFIIIRRKNIVQQAISLVVAARREAHSPEAANSRDDVYDADYRQDDILRAIDSILKGEGHIERLAAYLGVETLRLEYEAVARDPANNLRRVATFLGLADHPVAKTSMDLAIEWSPLQARWEERFRNELIDFGPFRADVINKPRLIESTATDLAAAVTPLLGDIAAPISTASAGVPTAVVLAGGRGTRLRPYTVTIPKPLVPVGDLPVVEIMIRKLARTGFGKVVLAVNHMGDLIRAYFGDGERWGIALSYSLEDEPLGTIAPLRIIESLPEHFLIVNADVLSDLDFSSFLDRHRASGAAFTIAATRREQLVDYGVLGVADGRLVSLSEKPSIGHLVSMGIYAASRRILDFIPATGAFGFDQLMMRMLAASERIDVFQHHGFWLDIGRPDDYALATDEVAQNPERFL